MKKSCFVLKAFGIIGPEEILKMAEVDGKVRQGKMVSGDSLLWDDAPEPAPEVEKVAKVIPFPKNKAHFQPLEPAIPANEDKKTEEANVAHFTSAEMVLLQREISREAEDSIQRISAQGGYRKTAEMFVIKSKNLDGKKSIRFVSTNGVLIDKKQA